jgi:D-arabinose 5-phosphate isomerase GutQ
MRIRSNEDLSRLAVKRPSESFEALSQPPSHDIRAPYSAMLTANAVQAARSHEDALSPYRVIENFLDDVISELEDLRMRTDLQTIECAAAIILDAEDQGGRVHVTGVGKSEYVARYLASLLSSTGTPAYFLNATECIHGSAGQVCAADAIIAISNSGVTAEVITAVGMLHNRGSRIIAVCGNYRSPLAGMADVLLHTAVGREGGVLNLAPRASILASLYLLCALTVVLETQKGLTREQYARWHPGGLLGQLARGEDGSR